MPIVELIKEYFDRADDWGVLRERVDWLQACLSRDCYASWTALPVRERRAVKLADNLLVEAVESFMLWDC